MAVRVQIPGPLRSLTAGASEVEVEAADVAALIEALEARHHGFHERLYDGQGQLRSYIRIFINDEDARSLGQARATLKAGDRVAIVPAIAGGAAT